MKNLNQLNTRKEILDLREWWEQIEQKDIEKIINNKDKWSYWWFNEDKTWVSTIKKWKVSNYRVNEIEILLNETSEKVSEIQQETKSEILTDLFLSPENRVKNTAAAYQRARYSDQRTFWFISAGNNKAIIVLDFSKWGSPKRTVYPLSKYNIKMKPVKI